MSRHDHIRGQLVLPYAKTISTWEAADMLKVSPETLRKMLEDGTLRGYRVRPNKKKSPWLVFKWSVEKHIARLMDIYAMEDNAAPSSANPAHGARPGNRSQP